eukprot:gene28438-35247_t
MFSELIEAVSAVLTHLTQFDVLRCHLEKEEVKEAVLQVMEDLDISDPASLTRAATESATGGSSVPGSSGNPAAVTSSAKFPVTAMCSACGSPAGAAALLRCGQCK